MNKSVVRTNIRSIIDSRGLKQTFVAEKAGIDYDRFNNMLNGRKLITSDDIIKLVPVLGVTPNDLYKGTF